jgi:hypothetical protein
MTDIRQRSIRDSVQLLSSPESVDLSHFNFVHSLVRVIRSKDFSFRLPAAIAAALVSRDLLSIHAEQRK